MLRRLCEHLQRKHHQFSSCLSLATVDMHSIPRGDGKGSRGTWGLVEQQLVVLVAYLEKTPEK